MTLQEIKFAINNLIDELDDDEQVDIIITNAINKAIFDLSKIDKRLSSAYCPVIMGKADLPDDALEVIQISPSLIAGERRIGNAILSNRKTTFEVMYNYTRPKLESDTDEPELHEDLHYAIVVYACAMYFKHRKKQDISNMYMQEYQENKYAFIQNLNEDKFGDGQNEMVVCEYGY